MNLIVKALMEGNVRLEASSRWLVFDQVAEEWVVYERKPYSKRTKEIIRTNSQNEAIVVLLEEEK